MSRTSRHRTRRACRRPDLPGLGGPVGQAPELGLPAAILPRSGEARRRRRDRRRQPDPRAHVPAHRHVSIAERRMFATSANGCGPREAPFHSPGVRAARPLQAREPWVRPGGTTDNFVNDGIESALRQARAAVGDRDIRIADGASRKPPSGSTYAPGSSTKVHAQRSRP